MKQLDFNQKQSLSLQDKDFLIALSEQTNREIYARIIALNIDEEPIDQIEGKVTGGSINIDGDSSVRRTCSLTLISENIDINEFYWGLKTKFILEIGLRNNLTGKYKSSTTGLYPDIIWFPQGYYIISSFNTSISTNNCTVSLQGKDKMCLLNGDFGGQLFASVDFGTEEITTIYVEPVSIDKTLSSEEILQKKYYMEMDYDKAEKQIIINKTIEEKPSYTMISIEKKNLIEEDLNKGIYYKDGNIYYKLIKVNNDFYIKDYYKLYKGYKLIENIEELYVINNDVNKNTYKTNTYYYKKFKDKDETYPQYILDSSNEYKIDRQYFDRISLYQRFTKIDKDKITIEKIIREAVHTYGKEPYHNIIIKDLEKCGLEQLTYKGDQPLYALYDVDAGQFTRILLPENDTSFDTLLLNENITYHSLNNITSDIGTRIYLEKDSKEYSLDQPSNDKKYKTYTIAKITYGMDIGYRLTDLVYNGDLISSIGENLTSILDKIKTMLGDFEYFYDINGRFVFQKKQTYIQTSWNQITNNSDEDYIDFINDQSKFSFTFEGNRLISAISNNPNLANLRNDYVVWGTRKSASGADIPIHGRYAIDKKPFYYKSLDNNIYTTNIKYAIEEGILTQEEWDNSISKQGFEIFNWIKRFNQKNNSSNSFYLDNLNKEGSRPKVSEDTGFPLKKEWWHINDWIAYYNILHGNEFWIGAYEPLNGIDYSRIKIPPNLIKFYTTNNRSGCVSSSTLLNLKYNDEDLFLLRDKEFERRDVWLIELNKDKKIINLSRHNGHITNQTFNKNEYSIETYKIEDNNVFIEKNKKIYTPYKNCDCSCEELFERQKSGEENIEIYIYNPRFSENDDITISTLIKEQILKETENDGFKTRKNLLENKKIHIVDWREIIYQMALDYFAGQGCSEKEPLYIVDEYSEEYYPMKIPDHFLYEVGKRNQKYYPTGYTGYEQYYTDFQGFWRELYNPNYNPEVIYSSGQINKNGEWIKPEIIDYNIEYYIDFKTEDTDLFTINITEDNREKMKKLKNKYDSSIIYTDYEKAEGRLYWNKNVFEHPEVLNFWIDFLDSGTELQQFSIPQVGDRIKVVKEDKIKAIVYSTIPDFILYDETQSDEDGLCNFNALRREIIDKSGYKFLRVPRGFSKYFTISCRNDSIKDKIDALLYQYGYCIENITLTTIPIYFLEPNTRIYVSDEKTRINGEYIVSKITIPLTYNGTMSITASKAPTRLY